MVRYILFAAAGAAFLSNCQYPADSYKLPSPKRYLVIDAALSEQYGRVKVAWTLSDVTPQGAYITPIPPQASAYVEDSQGNKFFFETNGEVDSTFKGKVGETYQLFVEADGESYVSAKETMRVCPELDSVTPIYTRESFRAPSDLNYDGFDVYANLKDNGAEENYYQWDWTHYERTQACDRVEISGQLYKVPCTPYDCWGIYRNTSIIVQNDKLRNGTAFAQKIVRVPFAQPPSRYYLRVEQRSITASVYSYLKSLETQTQNVGSIFDVPAQTKFSPNMQNVNNPDEKILGVFSVFSTRRKIIYIDMLQKIDGAQVKNIADVTPNHPNPLLQAPCTESDTRTQKKPEEWQD